MSKKRPQSPLTSAGKSLPATVTFVPKDSWTFVDRPDSPAGPRSDSATEGQRKSQAQGPSDGMPEQTESPTVALPRPPSEEPIGPQKLVAPYIPGYTLIRLLGEGTFGQVWEATDDKLDGRRRVAIKCFTRHQSCNQPLLRSEVEHLLKLSTDGRIVRLYDVGWDNDPPYFVMEHLAGGSLAGRLRGPHGEARSLAIDEVTRVARDIAKALAYLHANAFIHCDLKPANVLLNENGQVRLADFGQSRLRDEAGPAYGTLFYMPPEQIDPDTVTDVRVDIYALGAVIYEMLTGQPPYATAEGASAVHSSTSAQQRIARYVALIRSEAPVRGHREVAGVDPMLAAIVERCLEIDPAKRFQNVQQVSNALAHRRRVIAQRPLVRIALLVPLLLLLAMGAGGHWLGKLSNDGAIKTLVDTTLAKQLESLAFVSRTVEEDLRAAQRRVLREAQHESLRAVAIAFAKPGQALPRPTLPYDEATFRDLDRDPRRAGLRAEIKAQLDAIHQRYSGRGFYSWVLADPSGWIWARSAPTGEGDVVGKWFGYREWFSGIPEAPQGTEMLTHRFPRRRVGLTAPFRSKARGQPMLVSVAAPIFPFDSAAGARAEDPVAILSASISLDDLDLLFGAARTTATDGAADAKCPNSFITLLNRAALVRHPCADKERLPLDLYGIHTGLVSMAERFRAQDLESCTCTESDERAFGKPVCCHLFDDSVRGPHRLDTHRLDTDGSDADLEKKDPAKTLRYLAVAARLDPRIEQPGQPSLSEPTEAEGWVVIVQENLDSSIAPIRRLGRRFTLLLGSAVAAGLLLISLVWIVLFRMTDRLPAFLRRHRATLSLPGEVLDTPQGTKT